MPVTNNTVVSYVLIKVSVDMIALEGRAVLRKFVDGNAAGDAEFTVVGTDLTALLVASPVAGKTRGFDATDAIYQYAIDHGHISGTIA
jgi:hypothetical protein